MGSEEEKQTRKKEIKVAIFEIKCKFPAIIFIVYYMDDEGLGVATKSVFIPYHLIQTNMEHLKEATGDSIFLWTKYVLRTLYVILAMSVHLPS